jgi:hypothetical protein
MYQAVPDSTGSWGKRASNRVSTIQLPDGQYKQTGRETLDGLFTVHFSHSSLINDSDNGWGQPNLGMCR